MCVKKQTPTKRQLQAMETKNTIYNAAIELMDAEGYDNITIADISERAGVSVGSFYHHFESKHDILAEIFRKADEYFSDNVDGQLVASAVREKIVEYFGHYARFCVLTTVETTSQLFNPKVKFFIQEDRAMLQVLEDLIQAGIEAGEIVTDSEAFALVKMLFVFARGIVFDWSLHDGDYDLEQTMQEYMTKIVTMV